MRPIRSSLALLLFAAAACEPPRRPKEPDFVEDDWSRRAPTREWLVAMSEDGGDPKAECEKVLQWVRGEAGCKGAVCQYGRELAREWRGRCPGHASADSRNAVKELEAKLAAAAGEASDACAAALDAMVSHGCGPADKTCEAAAQSWGTRCGKAVGSPLSIRFVERAVERRLEPPRRWRLDLRSCDDFAREVRDAASCDHRFSCEDAKRRVDQFNGRCGSETTILVAFHAMRILAGTESSAALPAIPVVVESPSVGPDDVPVALADGSGGVVSVCGEKVDSVAGYLSARRACKGGHIVLVRAFKHARGLEVRLGALDFPDDETFQLRYPNLVALREAPLLDKEAALSFVAQLDQAVALASSPRGGTAAARTALKAIVAQAAWLRTSDSHRKALAIRDEALAPVFAEIGRAKVVESRRAVHDARGVVARALERTFEDVVPDGVVRAGASSRAAWLDLSALLPKATAAYKHALGSGLSALTQSADPARAEKERFFAIERARACGAAERKLKDSKALLVHCAFGIETCDAPKVIGLNRELDQARAEAELAYHDYYRARTGPASTSAADLERAAEAHGCREPWW